jgi:serine-type D-Ala-D-Ala carboxypeptidase/endopeptidase
LFDNQAAETRGTGETSHGKMKPSLLRISVMVILAAAQAASGQPRLASPVPPDSEIRNILANRVDRFRPGVCMIVGVIEPQGRRIVTYGSLGEKDLRSLTGDTLFEIGSITKVFTSLLLADMVQRGEVALSDPVAKFLPGVTLPERNGKRITLRDLAAHTSGFPKDAPIKTLVNPYEHYSPEQMYQYLSGLRLTRDIGSRWEYSNIGVALLGHALALRAGTDYEHLVATRITGPLGMNNTWITLTPDARMRLVTGHTMIGPPASENELGTWPAMGAMRSSAADLLTLLSAFLGHSNTPLAPAMALMVQTRLPIHDGQVQALGWQIGWPWRGPGSPESTIASHMGITAGFTSFAGYNPKTRVGVVVLANHVAIDSEEVGNYLLDQRFPLKRGKDLTPPKQRVQTAIDPELLNRYAGRYEFPDEKATVTREGDHLVLAGDGDLPDAFYAETNQDFFSKIQDLQVHFQIDGAGRVTGFVFHTGGKTKRVKRID